MFSNYSFVMPNMRETDKWNRGVRRKMVNSSKREN